MEYTQQERAELEKVALRKYAQSRQKGLCPDDSAQAAWNAVRAVNKRARALHWDEAVDLNTARRRSYRSPLLEVLSAPIRESFGQHSATWPRTKQSYAEAAEVKEQILQYLENHYEKSIA